MSCGLSEFSLGDNGRDIVAPTAYAKQSADISEGRPMELSCCKTARFFLALCEKRRDAIIKRDRVHENEKCPRASSPWLYRSSENMAEQPGLAVEEDIKRQGFCLVKGYLPTHDCLKLMKLVDGFVSAHFTRSNLENHSAYPSDRNYRRTSWAFALEPPSTGALNPLQVRLWMSSLTMSAGEEKQTNGLPRVSVSEWCKQREDRALLLDVTRRTQNLLGIVDGRSIFNMQVRRQTLPRSVPRSSRVFTFVQKYWCESNPIAPHR